MNRRLGAFVAGALALGTARDARAQSTPVVLTYTVSPTSTGQYRYEMEMRPSNGCLRDTWAWIIFADNGSAAPAGAQTLNAPTLVGPAPAPFRMLNYSGGPHGGPTWLNEPDLSNGWVIDGPTASLRWTVDAWNLVTPGTLYWSTLITDNGSVLNQPAILGPCTGTDTDGDGLPDGCDADDDNDCALDAADCNPLDANVHPGATERCNAVDDDCDGATDEDFADLGAACTAGVGACQRAGTVVCATDGSAARCDAVPGAPGAESCNGLDDDCDGAADNGGDALCAESAAGPVCLAGNAGAACGCTTDSDCGDAASGRLCDEATHACVSACAAGRNGCPAGEYCTEHDALVVGSCTMTCNADVDCQTAMPALPVCLRPEGGPSPSNHCVECAQDTDCAARADGRLLCVGAGNTCAECAADRTENCSAEGAGGACLAGGTCGCESDADCGATRFCDAAAHRCELRRVETDAGSDAGEDAGEDAAADAGEDAGTDAAVDAEQNAGQDAGQDASALADASTDGTTPDAAADAGAVADANADAGAGDDGATADAGADGGSAAPGGGCACSTAGGGASSARGSAALALALGLAVVARRRRRSGGR